AGAAPQLTSPPRRSSDLQNVWAEARKKSDFPAFAPWLDKIVTLKREEAKAVGYKESPYDALLDEYEPGATAAEITRVFAELRAEIGRAHVRTPGTRSPRM